MPHPFDIGQLASDIINAASGTLGEDVSAISGFSQTQVNLMTKQAAWIAEAEKLGELDDDLLDFFLRNLSEMARNFASVLEGLSLIAIEKVWNAVVNVLWDAIRTAAGGVPLPLPVF